MPKLVPRVALQKLRENDATLVHLDLSDNSIFQMKSNEYAQAIGEALPNNTNLKELHLAGNCISNYGAKFLGAGLKCNSSLKVVNLENNKIGSDGAQAIAEGLMSNRSIVDIRFLGCPRFGEKCLSKFIEMFEHNITLVQIKWRLDSRQSFKINQCITRNRDIARRVKTGKPIDALLPPTITVDEAIELVTAASGEGVVPAKQVSSSTSATPVVVNSSNNTSSSSSNNNASNVVSVDDETIAELQVTKQGELSFAEYNELRSTALDGDLDASIKLALVEIQKGNHSAAFDWFTQISENESATEGQIAIALSNLGKLVAEGHGETKTEDWVTAVGYWHQAANMGEANAMCSMAVALCEGRGGATKDVQQAFAYAHKAAKLGCAEAQVNLANMYLNGNGVEKDEAAAFYWLFQAASNGDADAYFQLAMAHLHGNEKAGISKNEAVVVETLKELVKAGHTDATCALGVLYLMGKGVAKNARVGIDLVKRAASNGSTEAKYWAATSLLNGLGCRAQPAKGFSLMQQAAKANHTAAMTSLAICFANGKGTKANETAAIEWLQQAATAGDATAQSILGARYATGKGVEQNDEVAVSYLEKASAQGDAEAMANLSIFYRSGRGGLSENSALADELQQKAISAST